MGLCVGSFLNVVIARVPEGRSIVSPGSACPRCATPIAWYDNIPLLSFAFLRARCRKCGEPISWRYPVVELITGFLFVWALADRGLTLDLIPALLLVTGLVAITGIDLDHQLIPDAISLPGIAVGIVASAVTVYEESLRLFPDQAHATILFARALGRVGRTEDAEVTLARAHSLIRPGTGEAALLDRVTAEVMGPRAPTQARAALERYVARLRALPEPTRAEKADLIDAERQLAVLVGGVR